jgi:SAM-dependent methyltransferase
LRLASPIIEPIAYGATVVEEVRQGAAVCPCGIALPIEEYVLSYEPVMPADIEATGRFWSAFYRFELGHGIRGHLSPDAGIAPLLSFGIVEAAPLPEGGQGGTEAFARLADHPLMRRARKVLDIGCGAGWSAIALARRGHDVVAIDPALDLVRLAKRHAIESGVFVEYVGGALGVTRFREATFDGAFALHSFHHMRDLGRRMEETHRVLRLGGCLAVDDHHQDNLATRALRDALVRWLLAEVAPRYASADPDALAAARRGAADHMCVSIGETVPRAQRLFHIRYLDTRYTFLDMFGTAYWLHRDQSRAAFAAASEIFALLHRAWKEVDPAGAEYVAFIGQKEPGRPRAQPLLADRRNPQKRRLRRLAYVYLAGGPRAVGRRVRARLRRALGR